eukprot:318632-Rhodomonas_salina.1
MIKNSKTVDPGGPSTLCLLCSHLAVFSAPTHCLLLCLSHHLSSLPTIMRHVHCAALTRHAWGAGDGDSAKVFQLETAMGAAIESFAGAGAIVVGRERFAPVKTCADLLRFVSASLRADAQVQSRVFSQPCSWLCCGSVLTWRCGGCVWLCGGTACGRTRMR